MSNCWWITPTEKLAQDFTFSRQDRFAAPIHCCQRMLTAHHMEIWCPPSLFPSPELQDSAVGPHSFSSGKMYTDWARIWPSMAVTPDYQPIRRLPLNFAGLSETSWVAAAMPAWSGLFICLILFGQYVITSYTQYTLNKVCIGPLCLYQRSKVNPELPRT